MKLVFTSFNFRLCWNISMEANLWMPRISTYVLYSKCLFIHLSLLDYKVLEVKNHVGLTHLFISYYYDKPVLKHIIHYLNE